MITRGRVAEQAGRGCRNSRRCYPTTGRGNNLRKIDQGVIAYRYKPVAKPVISGQFDPISAGNLPAKISITPVWLPKDGKLLQKNSRQSRSLL